MGRARGRDSECRRMGQRETGDKIRAGKPEVYTFCHSTYQSQRFLREGEMEAIEMLSCSEGGGGGGGLWPATCLGALWCKKISYRAPVASKHM